MVCISCSRCFTFIFSYFKSAVATAVDIMHASLVAVKFFMRESLAPDAPFLTTDVVLAAETTWQVGAPRAG